MRVPTFIAAAIVGSVVGYLAFCIFLDAFIYKNLGGYDLIFAGAAIWMVAKFWKGLLKNEDL